MPTSYIGALVKIPRVGGLPADAVVNTFHFTVESVPPDSGTLGDIATALGAAYDEIVPACSTLYGWEASMDVSYYNLADPEPRVPIETITVPISETAAGTKSLPTEVSLCLSFRGNYVSGTPNARRRGRVYLGPFAMDTSVDLDRPNGDYQTRARAMGDTLLAASDADPDWTWCIYSRATNSIDPLSSSFIPVVAGWVDNAWDNQRRRGLDATQRILFPI